MTTTVTKAVIPAAGLGTRFLPATKAIPKEMLPVVDKPAIQYVVEEAAAAGITDVLMVTGRQKTPLENHFDRVAELEETLERRGDTARLEAVRQATHLADIHYVRQGDPLGLGHAVLRARQHVANQPFAVLLGDDLVVDNGELLREMITVHERTGASVVAVQTVDPEKVSSYGVIATGSEIATTEDDRWPAVEVTGLVEKPAPEDAPSNLAIIGRYLLRPEVFDVLARTRPGRGGEIQLTDALAELAREPERTGGVIAIVFDGRRYDTGNLLGYLQASVELAMTHPLVGDEVRAWFEAGGPGPVADRA